MTQLSEFKKLNKEYKLGFTEKDIKAVGGCPHPDAVLTWNLDSLGKTIETKIEILKKKVNFYYIDEDFYNDSKVSLFNNTHKRGLKWVLLDTSANQGKSVEEVQDQNLAGVELLDLAIWKPEALTGQNGDDKPYWNIGNVRYNGHSEPYALFLRWDPFDDETRFSAYWVGYGHFEWASPSLRECSEPGNSESYYSSDLEYRVSALEAKLEKIKELL